jgi:hypothetical protein
MGDEKRGTRDPSDISDSSTIISSLIGLVCPCAVQRTRDRRRVGVMEENETLDLVNSQTIINNDGDCSERKVFVAHKSCLKIRTQSESLGMTSTTSLHNYSSRSPSLAEIEMPMRQTPIQSQEEKSGNINSDAAKNAPVPGDLDENQENDSKEEKREDSGADEPHRKKGVTFANVEVRHYQVCPSHNPSVPFGPAVGIGWTYEVIPTISVDKYEEERTSAPLGKGEKHQLRLSVTERTKVLRTAGCGDKEIRESSIQCARVRELRENTTQEYYVALEHDRVDEFDQSNENAPLMNRILNRIQLLCGGVNDIPYGMLDNAYDSVDFPPMPFAVPVAQ